MFSEKFCCCTIKVRKTIIKGITWSIFYLEVILNIVNVGVPTKTIGVFPVFPMGAPKMRFTQSISEQVKIAPVIDNIADKVIYTESEIDELQQSVFNQFKRGENLQQVINKLRAGGLDFDTAFAIALTGAIAYMMYVNRVQGFQPVHPYPTRIGEWGNINNGGPSHVGGYGKGAGPRSITVTGMTQNAGSEKKYPSSCSWDYKEVMRELDRQSSKKRIEVQVGDQIYILKNPYHEGPYELGDKLADQIYESIRKSDTDICDIAQNLGFKAANIKNVKDHVFYNEHDLDRYGPDQIERKQFDPNLQQALAWKRLETGTHTQDDVTWLKHECAERHHELKYDSGYN